MTRLVLVAVPCLFAASVGFSVTVQSPKEDDRLKQLEKRVADLEKEVAELRAQLKLPPKPALDNKLVGSWGVANVRLGLNGLRLETDGSFRMLGKFRDESRLVEGKYEVVGKTITTKGTFPSPAHPGVKINHMGTLQVVSVTEKALVVRLSIFTDKEEEVPLERQ